MRILSLWVVLAFVPGMGPATAQEAGRYRLERTDDGYVRMDLETGRMALCAERSGQFVCRMAAEDRDAYEDEIAALRNDLEALETRIEALEAENGSRGGLLSDEEFDRSLGMMETFFRRFMGVVREFERDFPEDDRAPDRT